MLELSQGKTIIIVWTSSMWTWSWCISLWFFFWLWL